MITITTWLKSLLIVLLLCSSSYGQIVDGSTYNPWTGELDKTLSDTYIDASWLRLDTDNDPLTNTLHIQPGDYAGIFLGTGDEEVGGRTPDNSIIFTEVNDGSGSDGIRWLDGSGANVSGIYGSTIGGLGVWIHSLEEIRFAPDGDTDDYIMFETETHVPRITTVGASDLKITSSGGGIEIEPGAVDSLYLDGTTTRTGTTELLNIDATINTTTATDDVPVITVTATRDANDTGETHLIKGDLTTGYGWNNKWSYVFGGTIDTSQTVFQTEVATFYAGTPTVDGNAREYGIYVEEDYDYAAWFNGYQVIQMDADQPIGLFIDGETNDYTGTSISEEEVFHLSRDVNWGDDHMYDITGINGLVTLKNTATTFSIANYWRGMKAELKNEGNLIHDDANTGFLWMRAGELELDDDGTYDTAVNQSMLIFQTGLEINMSNQAEFTDSSTTTPAASLSTYGIHMIINDKPTLTSGSLARQTNGIYLDIEASATGSSEARGLYISTVEGGDVNYGIKDVSGAPWETESDLIFVEEGSGLSFGEIYMYNNSTADSIATATWTQLVRFDTVGQYNNTTPSSASDDITILTEGKYFITMSTAFSGSGGVTWTGGVWKNNGGTQLTNLQTHRKLGASGDVGSATVSGFADLAVNDTVEVWFQQSEGVNKNITVKDCTLTVTMVGGT